MRIGLDLDGPVYPWHDEIYRYFQENHGYAGNIYDFWQGEGRALIKDWHLDIPFLYNSTTPRQDVLTYVPLLAELGEIYYITARNKDLWQVTGKFFDFYELPFKENVIFDKDKAFHTRRLGLDYFLDDNRANVDSLLGITDAYLFTCIHNLHQREGVKTVSSMREFYEVIRR